MDLSFPGFDRNTEVTRLPGDLAVLMVGIAARQSASPTAVAQAEFGRIGSPSRLLQPRDGAFNGPTAALLARWGEA
ncbi:hypothetical protein M9979_05545 [Sphingomonas sp. RP10(2022)]|uniref:Uncharacterized protein n=1 Tax=Sphingomonas liriopis TaxID=2949094 RepID=A0A9X2HYE8_9SPHN|nr:hypothetical protein [Sphingomonas liriopis]MCP3734340.1 hypothetical protein [Sphingomonas liriopis]